MQTGLDGGMNRVFLAQVGGNIPPARVPPPRQSLPPQPPPVGTAVADNTGGTRADAGAARFLAASSDRRRKSPRPMSATQERGPEPSATGTTATPKAKPRAEPSRRRRGEADGLEPRKTEPPRPRAPQERAATATARGQAETGSAQQEANAAAPSASATMNGAQPVVPAGNFDSRWGGSPVIRQSVGSDDRWRGSASSDC